jgi:hypothetical protein
MKKSVLFLILSVIFLGIAKPAEAHFLATDGNIGAILHVDPNDSPVAGSQASFFFEFKDKQNKFKPENCNCTFEIDENGKTIFYQLLFQSNSNPNLSNASVFYTFPRIDVYEIKVVGNPEIPNAFQPFTLKWYFRVDQQANQTGSDSSFVNFFSDHVSHIIPIALIVFGFAFYIYFNGSKTKNRKEKGGGKKHNKEDHNNMY